MYARSKSHRPTEAVKYGFIDTAAGIEVLQARFDRHEFGNHSHETWAVGAVITGAKNTSPRRDSANIVRSGDLYVIPAFDAHAGKSAGDAGCEYVMIYVSENDWEAQCAAYGVPLDRFSMTPFRDPQLAAHLNAFVRLSLEHAAIRMNLESEWQIFCERFLHRYRSVNPLTVPAPSARADRLVRRAHDYLREHWNSSVSLDELARQASMSTYELCRRFAAAYRLSPHRYQLVLRIQQAKSQLLKGASIADVATDTGFADQSHLGRHFKSVLGITPGVVAKEAGRARTF